MIIKDLKVKFHKDRKSTKYYNEYYNFTLQLRLTEDKLTKQINSIYDLTNNKLIYSYLKEDKTILIEMGLIDE